MNNFKNHPAYQAMEQEKRNMFEELASSLQNKKLTEALPIVMAWQETMKQKNLTFTNEENNLLTAILTAQMTPAQRKQYEALKPFMKKK